VNGAQHVYLNHRVGRSTSCASICVQTWKDRLLRPLAERGCTWRKAEAESTTDTALEHAGAGGRRAPQLGPQPRRSVTAAGAALCVGTPPLHTACSRALPWVWPGQLPRVRALARPLGVPGASARARRGMLARQRAVHRQFPLCQRAAGGSARRRQRRGCPQPTMRRCATSRPPWWSGSAWWARRAPVRAPQPSSHASIVATQAASAWHHLCGTALRAAALRSAAS